MSAVANPILPGCYPDPSVCRVRDDYYLVTSTFEYLPGLPIFHSRDLAHWAQIGHVIDRDGMLHYDGIGSSGGLYAPTIRYNDGTYYVVCTLVDRDMNKDANAPAGNFIVTAKNPAGPWSEPIWLNKNGIDPSLFFDDDGRIWLHGTRLADPGEWYHQTEVWLQELDKETLEPFGPEHILWTGALKGAVWAEGPHIYKIGDYYYLLAAEAGTEFHHAISVARAKEVTGPYEGNKGNPILTHRHLGRTYPVMGVGHADLTQGPDGSWWAVMLAMRLYGGYHYNLGRETFLVPVIWEDDWPVFAPGVGRIPDKVEVPFPEDYSGGSILGDAKNRRNAAESLVNFPVNCIIPPEDLRWSALRHLPTAIATPVDDGWRLPVWPITLAEPFAPAFLALRQQYQDCQIRAELDLSELAAGESAGIAVRQSEKDYATLLVAITSNNNETGDNAVLTLTHNEKGVANIIERKTISMPLDRKVTFGIDIRQQDYLFGIAWAASDIEPDRLDIVGVVDGRTLDTAAAGGFLGLWLGVYATSHGAPSAGAVTARVGYYCD